MGSGDDIQTFILEDYVITARSPLSSKRVSTTPLPPSSDDVGAEGEDDGAIAGHTGLSGLLSGKTIVAATDEAARRKPMRFQFLGSIYNEVGTISIM